MDRAPRRTQRRVLVGLTLTAIATGMLSTVSLTAEANPFCLVRNLRTGIRYVYPQRAIDHALSGDTLTVEGVCFADLYVDGKTVRFRGVPTPARRYPTLDGANSGPVLTVRDGSVVTIKDLVITHGQGGAEIAGGGGILLLSSTLVLSGSTRVVHSFAFEGGGIYAKGSSLRFGGSTRVNLNEATNGGGVFLGAGSTLTMNRHSRVNRNLAIGRGGGLWIATSSLAMHAAATIVGNSSETEGGGIWNARGVLMGAAAGGNVRNNTPNDIAP